jgi:Protein of unknown function (DUF3617)
MRTKTAFPIALALALAACGQHNTSGSSAPAVKMTPPSPPAPAALPHRREGLWDMRMSMDGLDMVQSTQICLDKTSEQKVALWGAQSNHACSKSVVQRQLDGSWRFEANCDMGSGGWVMTKGSVSGDLSSHYVVQSETTRTGAAVPQMNRTMKVTIEAKRVGDCPAGWTGGDMSVGGMRANALKVETAR